tara:strand:+ start:69 stop:233 length:165 start_codon:yes stop_codon:yes gene_type:complete
LSAGQGGLKVTINLERLPELCTETVVVERVSNMIDKVSGIDVRIGSLLTSGCQL